MDIVDFRGVSNQHELEKRFVEIAEQLMSRYEIELRHRPDRPRLQISALELYYYNEKVWKDNSCHFKKFHADVQSRPWCWYVHHDANRYPTRIGIDITVGAGDETIGASLLVRAVNEFDGPGYALNTMLFGPHSGGAKRNWAYKDTMDATFGNKSAKDFLKKLNATSAVSIDGPLGLVPSRGVAPKDFFIGRRIGLGRSEAVHKNAHLRLTTFKAAKDLSGDRTLVELDKWRLARGAD
ncbi:MAG: hypothetical protein KIT48_03915 [Pseudolabrys sp.]|nr:hypothetical protein [Pseudolabrys sp.]